MAVALLSVTDVPDENHKMDILVLYLSVEDHNADDWAAEFSGIKRYVGASNHIDTSVQILCPGRQSRHSLEGLQFRRGRACGKDAFRARV